MRALHSIDKKSTAAAALLTAGAVLLAGCGVRDLSDARVQTSAAAPAAAQVPGAPMAVSCEPNQRAIVRPVVVNGAALSQVECVTNVAPAATPVAYQTGFAAPVPAAYSPAATAQPAVLDNARIVQNPTVVQPAPQRVVYQRAPERIIRPKRSVQKSAIIIGSSAGAGAGLGAIIGGKKGALIGAAVGGGGATLWDQITRNKQ
jgi:hypothetical protein